MAVDTTTFLADFKYIYGELRDQISTEAKLMNLFGDGTKFGKPVSNIGARGFTFLARMGANWNMGFRAESATAGVGLAGYQALKNATVTLKYFYSPVTITGQAENLSKGDSKAFMQAKALEMKYDMLDAVSHVNVVLAGAEAGGELATVLASPAPTTTTFSVSTVGGLPGAIYLRVGQVIDTTPNGGAAHSVTANTISAIDYPTNAITCSSAAVGTAVSGDAVTISGEYPVTSAAFPLTIETLATLVNDSGALEGLNPSTSGEERWSSYESDATSATISSPIMQELRQFVKNRSGADVDLFLFPSAQINQLVNIATQQLRFDVPQGSQIGKKAVDLGFTTYNYAGLTIVEDKDLRPDRIYAGASDAMKKFEVIPLSLAEDEAATWTRIYTTTGIADAVAALARWYLQIGTLQRNAWGVKTGLAVPDAFNGVPATL